MFTKYLAKHDDDQGEEDESEEVGGEFFIAGGDAPELFEFVEETLDLVALLVTGFVVDEALQAVGLGRDDRRDALGLKLGADGVAVIGFVHDGLLDSFLRIKDVDESLTNRCIPHLPCREVNLDHVGFRSAQDVNFRRQSAAGTAEGLITFFLAAPAAC